MFATHCDCTPDTRWTLRRSKQLGWYQDGCEHRHSDGGAWEDAERDLTYLRGGSEVSHSKYGKPRSGILKSGVLEELLWENEEKAGNAMRHSKERGMRSIRVGMTVQGLEALGWCINR